MGAIRGLPPMPKNLSGRGLVVSLTPIIIGRDRAGFVEGRKAKTIFVTLSKQQAGLSFH